MRWERLHVKSGELRQVFEIILRMFGHRKSPYLSMLGYKDAAIVLGAVGRGAGIQSQQANASFSTGRYSTVLHRTRLKCGYTSLVLACLRLRKDMFSERWTLQLALSKGCNRSYRLDYQHVQPRWEP